MLTLFGVSGGNAAVAGGTHRHPPRLMVGAYYYSWNPENMAEGTLRSHLVPAQQPPPALVDNANPQVAAQAISQAERAGLSFFALDWWPLGSSALALSVRLKSDDNVGAFLKAPNLNTFKFCMFYETWSLGFDPTRETTVVTPELEARFDADMLLFARTFFANRSYLRIHGRPVVVLYLTRVLVGDVAGMINGARATLERIGYDPFFIGDEMYWRVAQLNPPPTGSALTLSPQVARIEDFDAITAYTMYYGAPDPTLGLTQNLTGYPGRTPIVRDERQLIDEYRTATRGRVPVLPDVSPGFNDRGVRLPTDHPAQPRQWLPGEGPASTLDHLFRQVVVPEVDPHLPLAFVTAWSEWNEDTGIAPIPGTATQVDDSAIGRDYTQGYSYGGESSRALAVLRTDIARADQRFAGA